MHAAPPVAVRCTAGWVWRGLQSALPALAVGVLVFWSLSTWDDDEGAWLHAAWSSGSALLVGVLAWRRTAQPDRRLDWDGQLWSLDGQPGELQLMIDLGRAMLLRHGGQQWLLAESRHVGAAWHGLRVAVHARSAPKAIDDGLLNA